MNCIDYVKSKKGISYKDISVETGLSVSYIHMLAKGKRNNPSLDTMQRIAKALNEPVERVFKVNA